VDGASNFVVDIDGDFDSVPCDANGTPLYTAEQWVSQTKHTVRVYYGATAQSFTFTDTHVSGLTVSAEASNVTMVQDSKTETALTQHISALTANNGTIIYKLYNGTLLVATAKFEATKQVQGATGDDAIDYYIGGSASSFHQNPNTTQSAITPKTITVDAYFV